MAHARLAQFLYWLGQYEAALRAYREALAHNPGDTGLRREYGQLLLWTGRHREAVAVYRKLMRELPGDENLPSEYLEAAAGARPMDDRERNWVQDFYRSRFLAKEPLQLSTLVALGRALSAAGLLVEAAAVFEVGLKQAPEDMGLRLAYADLLVTMGRNSEAETQYEILLQKVGKISREPSP